MRTRREGRDDRTGARVGLLAALILATAATAATEGSPSPVMRADPVPPSSTPAPTPAAVPAPVSTPLPGIGAAMARLNSGDAPGASKILEDLALRDPKNPQIWRALGVTSIKAKNLDRAEAALRKALELEPGSPRALYNLGVVYAQRGDADKAFDWLTQAKASRKIDMSYVAADTDLDVLRKDPRYPELLPKPADFANPFVESVRILHEWDGEAPNDQFGWIARDIGDVDGDGVHDLVTSAPTSNRGGEKAGRIYVYSGRSGALLWAADGKPGEQLGTGVEAAGDTNRDGIPDVVAGAPGSGHAYVYSGKDGRLLRALGAGDVEADFGRHVSAAGDADGDGYADVIVGSPGVNGKGSGHAYVYSGKDGRALLTLTGERDGDGFGSTVAGYSDRKHRFLVVGAPAAGPGKAGRTYVFDRLAAKPKFVIEADATGAALGGMFVSVVGDADGDGVPDIYASDFSNGAKGPSTGRVYVHSGKDGRRLMTLTGETAGEGFGIGPATAGDVDGDGHADLIVGAWQYAGAAVSGGRAYLYSGKDGQLLKTYTCRIPGDTFGFDAVGMGDVDGDGTVDFLITSAWSGIHGYHSGRMFLISSGIPKSGAVPAKK